MPGGYIPRDRPLLEQTAFKVGFRPFDPDASDYSEWEEEFLSVLAEDRDPAAEKEWFVGLGFRPAALDTYVRKAGPLEASEAPPPSVEELARDPRLQSRMAELRLERARRAAPGPPRGPTARRRAGRRFGRTRDLMLVLAVLLTVYLAAVFAVAAKVLSEPGELQDVDEWADEVSRAIDAFIVFSLVYWTALVCLVWALAYVFGRESGEA